MDHGWKDAWLESLIYGLYKSWNGVSGLNTMRWLGWVGYNDAKLVSRTMVDTYLSFGVPAITLRACCSPILRAATDATNSKLSNIHRSSFLVKSARRQFRLVVNRSN